MPKTWEIRCGRYRTIGLVLQRQIVALPFGDRCMRFHRVVPFAFMYATDIDLDRGGAMVTGLPRPPLRSPPPVSLLTVAQARRSA